MPQEHYDVAIIGAGPGGYVAAIRAAQKGFKTICIDKWVNKQNQSTLGGTCLNVGCIPSKALLDSSEVYAKLKSIGEHGIQVENIQVDIEKMMARKDKIVSSLTKGIESLFKANQVVWRSGQAKLVSPTEIKISSETITASHIILAPGSLPISIPHLSFDDKTIVDSTGALEFPNLPKKLGIIGAGFIGLELGSVWNRLGSEVTILEAQAEFLPMVDRQLADIAYKEFTKQGIRILLGTQVVKASSTKTGVQVLYQKGQKEEKLEVDKLVVAAGRRPYSEHIAESTSGLKIDKKGFIEVDQHCRTSLPNVYAIGDVVRGPMLAHKASEEAIAVIDTLTTGHGHVNYSAIPSVVYTHPEIAWVGKREEELKLEGIEYKVGTFPFAANGRAKAMNESVGLVKILGDKTTDKLLGLHVIGPFASELVHQGVIAMEFGASVEDLQLIIFAHPTLSEAVHEAALSADERAIHRVNKGLGVRG
ncbi:MAG: dihydrolipoyl dehydrogenase [Gammaproteobacteria bacterium]|nr:dihydrolipoyl dehydrogenase [Gammaproteobacteria bacterium]